MSYVENLQSAPIQLKQNLVSMTGRDSFYPDG